MSETSFHRDKGINFVSANGLLDGNSFRRFCLRSEKSLRKADEPRVTNGIGEKARESTTLNIHGKERRRGYEILIDSTM